MAGLLLIKEPKRGKFDVKAPAASPATAASRSPFLKFIAAASELFVVPTCRYATIAGSFRFFGGYAIGFFMPSYFNGIYPDDKKMYSILNSFVVSLCGFVSAITGGLVCDYYEKKGYFMTKAYVCIFAGALGLPMMMGCTLL
jgi:predicted MFS family arabinose efflux permease